MGGAVVSEAKVACASISYVPQNIQTGSVNIK